MDCLHPLVIQNPSNDQEYVARNPKILVPCGRCEACIISSANQWRVRLQIENQFAISAFFVTLTYDDDKIPYAKCSNSFGETVVAPVVCKRDCQLFFKRLRKLYETSQIRYFLCSEYGPSTFRPHYHVLVFGIIPPFDDHFKTRIQITKDIQKCWSNGFVTVDDVTDGRISYVTKYLSCTTDLPEYLPKPFRLMSRRPGLGAIYMDQKDRIEWHRNNLSCYFPQGKSKFTLPRFLKDKIFDDSMKADIKESIDSYRVDKQIESELLAKRYGYSNRFDFEMDRYDRLIRKFNGKFKKSRKNI